MDMPPEVLEQLLDAGPKRQKESKSKSYEIFCLLTDPVIRTFLYPCRTLLAYVGGH